MSLKSKIRKTAKGLLRHSPALLHKVRQKYWKKRGEEYEQHRETIPTNPKSIIFESFMGRSYSCSPRALYEVMVDDPRFADWDFYWSFKKGRAGIYQLPEQYRQEPDGMPIPTEEGIRRFEEDHLTFLTTPGHTDAEIEKEAKVYEKRDYDMIRRMERAHVVVRGSDQYYQVMPEAKFWVSNSRSPEYVSPKDDQVYIQCWHGTPLKRLGNDIQVETTAALNTSDELAERYELESSKWSYLVSPSHYTTEHLCSAFGMSEEDKKNKVLEIGYPRNDYMVNSMNDAEVQKAIKKHLGIPEDKKLALYAPTWRDSDYKTGVGYVFDNLIDFDELQKMISNEWVILFRPHYFIANAFDFSKYEGFVYNVANVPDINDLYIIADTLITDYSSVFFDYACTGRPLMFFMPDIKDYGENIRGFYLDPMSLPGPHTETTQELGTALQNFNDYFNEYGEAYQEFRKEFCPKEDGQAAKRLADKIAQIAGV